VALTARKIFASSSSRGRLPAPTAGSYLGPSWRAGVRMRSIRHGAGRRIVQVRSATDLARVPGAPTMDVCMNSVLCGFGLELLIGAGQPCGANARAAARPPLLTNEQAPPFLGVPGRGFGMRARRVPHRRWSRPSWRLLGLWLARALFIRFAHTRATSRRPRVPDSERR
jgi:hypothetical protein